MARKQLEERGFPFTVEQGRRYLLLSSDEDQTLVDGLDLEPVTTVREADFILLAGVRDDRDARFYQAMLDQALSRRCPLVCINPDRVRFSAGRLTFSAGAVAEAYQAMGGVVHAIGKPYPAIYHYCQRLFPDLIPELSLAVGDSLFHDVQGGARFGVSTAWVTSGIHQYDPDMSGATNFFGIRPEQHPLDVEPDWVIEHFNFLA